jgi:hypothetical protein
MPESVIIKKDELNRLIELIRKAEKTLEAKP